MKSRQEDNPRSLRIVVLVDDLFFLSRIRSAAEKAGAEIITIGAESDAIQKIVDTAPHGILIDLEARTWDAVKVLEQIQNIDSLSLVPKVGFYSHVRSELGNRAKNAGCGTVLPRSAFSKMLADFEALFRSNTRRDSKHA